jgi:hypothetical protein
VQTENLIDQLELVLPLAVEWAFEQEQRILLEGDPLSGTELADANVVGVQHPERVRVLPVEAIPSPSHPILKAVSEQIELLPSDPSGLTLQYGIFVRGDCRQDRHLVVHELVHTAQYERLGGILPFLRDYLFDCATLGYGEAPLEQEAAEAAARICGSGSAFVTRAAAGALASGSLG